MNPSLLTTFSEHGCSSWIFPVCQSVSLGIQAGSFRWEALPASVARRQNSDAELEEIELVLSCLLKCDQGSCGTFVVASGSGYVTETPLEAVEEGEPPQT